MSGSPASPARSAGVRIDPQLIYAVPLAAGLLLDRWSPMRALPPRLAAPVGVALLVLGLVVCLQAVLTLRRAKTTLQPWEPTTALVTDGPYRLSRNPIYVGYTLLYLGGAFWENSSWPLVLLPLVLFVMYRAVITREETYLEGQFRDAYRAYRHRVRRWL